MNRHRDCSDEALLAHFARGRQDAFTELVRRYGAAIKGFAIRMLHSPEQAEEIYVETFLRVANSRGRWELRGTVRGYLFTIARRLCLDELRHRQVQRRAYDTVVEIDWAWSPPSPEARCALGQTADALERALARLPSEHRDVLLMRTVHGLSAEETALATGLSEDQVYSQLSYARRRLRELMEAPRREEARWAR